MGLRARPNAPSQGPQAGITLVEVMITLFVLALATSAIIMNFPPSDSSIARAEMRTEKFISDVFENAQLRGQTYKIALDDVRLVVFHSVDGSWRELDSLSLPAGVTGYQYVETEELQADRNASEALIGPHLSIYPIGFMDAGVWVLEYDGEEIMRQITLEGKIETGVEFN